jgi:opacity protein-like surface antigen
MRTLPLVLLLSLPGVAAAQSADRTGTWEAGFKLMDTSGEFVNGENGSSLDIDSELAWGFAGAYHVNEHLQFGAEITWSDPNYFAEFPLDPSNVVVTVDAELDIWSTDFKATFNLLDRSFTPYAEIGYGWTVVDSNIQDGAADTGCWWDPWWGYMCASFYDTYESTITALSYGVGLRWDLSDSSVLKASYGIREYDLDRAEDLEQDAISVEFAWKF